MEGEFRGGSQEAQSERLPDEAVRDKNVQLPVIISLIKIILVNNIPGGRRQNYPLKWLTFEKVS